MRKATLFNIRMSFLKIASIILLVSSVGASAQGQTDCPPLTVFCQDLHTSFMPDACMVEVWAKDFISKINDPDTDLDDFIISFEEDSEVMSRTYESIFGDSYEVTIWVTSRCDPSDQTRCVVTLDINDNTGSCPTTPCPVDPNPWCGFAVMTCTTVQQTSTETTGHVAALVDTRKNSQAPRGDNWSDPIATGANQVNITRPEAWRISNLGNIYGIALNPNNGDIFLGASDVYDFDFQQFVTQGPPPPSVTGPAGAAGIYRANFSNPEATSTFVSTRSTYPSPASFNATIIGANLIPNTGNSATSNALSGNGIGNLDYDQRSSHLFVSNLEDGKLYSINASSGLITDVFDPFGAYQHVPGLVTDSERIWGVQVNDCGPTSRLFFARNAQVPSTAPDVIQPKEIWSVALNPDGTFVGAERIEIVVARGDMSKITDLSFSSDCTSVLVAERGNAHSAEMMRYTRASDNSWQFDTQFFLGLNDPNNTNPNYPSGIVGNSAAGGVAYGPAEQNCVIDQSCDGVVWGTLNCGEIIADFANPPNGTGCAIYGAEGINATGNQLATNRETDIFVSLADDVNAPTLLKSNIGDIEIFNCCCPFEEGRNVLAQTTGAIAGEVYTEEKYRVTSTQVQVASELMNEEVVTNQYGEYGFSNLAMHADYDIIPNKKDATLDGLTTLDLVLIQRHVLGLTRLNSPYKVIAADVNEDNKVSVLDLVSLRRLILGVEVVDESKAWVFVPQAFNFIDEKNPFPFESNISLNDLESNMMHEDFIAIKRGDVNGDTKYNLTSDTRSKNQIALQIELKNNMAYVSLSESQIISGLQLELTFSNSTKVPYEIISGILQLQTSDYVIDGNSVKISWAGPTSNTQISAEEILFSFPISEVDAEEIELENNTLNSEIYLSDFTSRDLVLNTSNSLNKLNVIGNSPNPFADETNIFFELETEQEVTFEFYSISGQQINTVSQIFTKGENALNVDNSILNSTNSGIIFYRIETKDNISYGKMIKL